MDHEKVELAEHPWWSHVPTSQRSRLMAKSRWRRLKLLSAYRKNQMMTVAGIYLVLCLTPMFFGAKEISLLALMPILLLPCVAALVWWLTWKEYHD